MNAIDKIKARKRQRVYNKKKYNSTKESIFEILGGPRCSRCGFSDIRALQIDHINGGGNSEEKVLGSRYNIYLHYVKNPEIAKKKLQILCANCNWIKKVENNELFK